jgi:hypothetical protein
MRKIISGVVYDGVRQGKSLIIYVKFRDDSSCGNRPALVAPE